MVTGLYYSYVDSSVHPDGGTFCVGFGEAVVSIGKRIMSMLF
jgi:hypothetical protein